MKKNANSVLSYLSVLALFILILDTKTAIQGTKAGIELCIKTLVPTLFPFIIISSICGEFLLGSNTRMLNALLRPCKMPKGTENIFLIGLLGSYPVGAKLISDAYDNKSISSPDAQRMLMFCSNAGPSFIFGILGQFFSEKWVPWVLWGIHALSAYLVGIITAKEPSNCIPISTYTQISLTKTVSKATKNICSICSWVILFRLFLAFLDRWFLWIFPCTTNALICGLLELSNGCMRVSEIENSGLRFLSSLLIITFGGLCIVMQTATIAPQLPIKKYVAGKVYQCIIAIIIALPMQALVFPTCFQSWKVFFAICLIPLILIITKHMQKKDVAFRRQMLYNIKKC